MGTTITETAVWPISAATAYRRYQSGALLVDIRPQVARHQGSIDGAVLVEAADFDERFSLGSGTRLPEADRDRDIVVCGVNTRRTQSAADRLAQLGYRRVYFLAGGYAAWQHRHQPIH